MTTPKGDGSCLERANSFVESCGESAFPVTPPYPLVDREMKWNPPSDFVQYIFFIVQIFRTQGFFKNSFWRITFLNSWHHKENIWDILTRETVKGICHFLENVNALLNGHLLSPWEGRTLGRRGDLDPERVQAPAGGWRIPKGCISLLIHQLTHSSHLYWVPTMLQDYVMYNLGQAGGSIVY